MKICALIITFNEELHIERCINSLLGHVDDIYVVDSFSSDRTHEILKKLEIRFCCREFVSHSDQINYGLKQLRDNDFVFRLDADEILTNFNRLWIQRHSECSGFYVQRSINFLGQPVRYGGVKDRWVLRICDPSKTVCEDVLMDERFIVDGRVENSDIKIIDDNLNSFDWWLDKHIRYSKRQCEDLKLSSNKYTSIPKKFFFFRSLVLLYQSLGVKSKLLGYLIYRLIIRGGFRDGNVGFLYHLLQGIAYRAMVEVRLLEERDNNEK